MEVGDGSGYLGVGRAGQVVYLDNEGHAELNGTVLAATLASFWSAWASLCFVDLRPTAIDAIRSGGGLTGGRLAQQIRAILGS